MNHHIRIDPGRDGSNVGGAVRIADAKRPVQESAQALLARGASPNDVLNVSCSDCTVIPQPLARIVANRPRPRSLLIN